MNHYQRQKYLDVIHTKVDPLKYPICQLKYDGIWCAGHVYNGGCSYTSRNGARKKYEQIPHLVDCAVIGELMYGSEWAKQQGREGNFYIFDILELQGTDCSQLPYSQRYELLQELRLSMPKHWSIVPNFPTTQCQEIWKSLVDTTLYEGLVFRNPNHLWDTIIPRAKFELELDLTIVGFEEGAGRLRGTLGTILAKHSDTGPIIKIGGGLSDDLRTELWFDQDRFLGRVFKATAKKQFESGLLRHGNFKEWHSDKT